jgi:hypothetical protein
MEGFKNSLKKFNRAGPTYQWLATTFYHGHRLPGPAPAHHFAGHCWFLPLCAVAASTGRHRSSRRLIPSRVGAAEEALTHFASSPSPHASALSTLTISGLARRRPSSSEFPDAIEAG